MKHLPKQFLNNIIQEGDDELKKNNSEVSNYNNSINFWEKKVISNKINDDYNNQIKPLENIIQNKQDNDISNNITLKKSF